MSIFVNEAEADALTYRARTSASAQPDDFAPNPFVGVARGIGLIPGALQARAEYGLASAFEGSRGTLETIDRVLGTSTADFLTATQEATKRNAAAFLPRAWELGTIGGAIHQFGIGAAELIGPAVLTSPAGPVASRTAGAAYTTWVAGLNRELELRRQADEMGLVGDPEAITRAAFTSSAIQGLSIFFPGAIVGGVPGLTFGTRLAAEMAGQAAINVGTGIVQRGEEARQLRAGGFDRLAEMIEPFGTADILIDAAIGAVLAPLGVSGHYRVAGQVPATPAVDGAMASRNVKHAAVDTLPGVPKTPADAEAHVEALVRSTEQILRGEPVRVENIVGPDRFDSDPVRAARAELEADVEVARAEIVAEAQRAHAEALGYEGPFDVLVRFRDEAAPVPIEGERRLPAWRAFSAAGGKVKAVADALERPGETISADEFGDRARRKFLALVRAHGGIERSELGDIAGGDSRAGKTSGRGNLVGGGVFRKGGLTMDNVVAWMKDRGYLSRDETRHATGERRQEGQTGNTDTGEVDAAREMIRDAIDGRPVMTPAELERRAELAQRDAGMAEDARTEMQRREAEASARSLTEDDLDQIGYNAADEVMQNEFDNWFERSLEWEAINDDIDRIAEALGVWRADGGEVPAGDGTPRQGEAEATARDDGAGRSAQAVAREADADYDAGVAQQKGAPYTGDLFGKPLAPAGRAAKAAPRAASAPNELVPHLDLGGTVEPGLTLPVGRYSVLTKLERVAALDLPISEVRDATDAALVTSHLDRFPQENMVALALDKDRRPLFILRAHVGKRGEVYVDSGAIVGALARDDRVASFYASHNHPSASPGRAQLSRADRNMADILQKVAGAANIKFHGMMAVGGGEFTLFDGAKVDYPLTRYSTRRDVGARIPIVERVYTKNEVLHAAEVTSPGDAIAIAKTVSGGERGVMLVNNRLFPVAFLKGDGLTMRDLLKALESSNARGVFLVADHLADFTPATIDGIRSLAYNADVELMDAVAVGKTPGSGREKGIVREPEGGKSGDLLTTYTNEDILQREQERLAAAGMDAAAVEAAKRKAQVDAQRDTFALTGSDREADQAAAAGQRSLFESAPEYRVKSRDEEAAEIVDANGLRNGADAVEWMLDDRSHGDEYLADAASRVLDEAEGDANALARVPADQIVARALALADEARAADEGSAVAAEPQTAPARPPMSSVGLLAGDERLPELEGIDKPNRRRIGEALQARAQRLGTAIGDNNYSPQAEAKIADAIADEVEHQLRTESDNATGSGVGWYSHDFPEAVRILADSRFPELAQPEGRSQFTFILAISSNGEEVPANAAYAVEAYARSRGKGHILLPEGRGTRRDIAGPVAKLNEEFDKLGSWEKVAEKMAADVSVAEMNVALRKMGEAPISGYQASVRVPRAVAIMGPKLGAFFANLSGRGGYLTMDLWWSRSINRMRGALIPYPTEAGLQRFRSLLGEEKLSDEETILATIPYWMDYKAKNYKNGTEIEKAANTIFKNLIQLNEAPSRATDRSFMIRAAQRAQQTLISKGYNLTLADVQAALWYYEKRLYATLSGKAAVDVGYAEAIRGLAAGDRHDGPRVARPPVEVRAGGSKGGGHRARAPGAGQQAADVDYRDFPGTPARPVPRDAVMAAADARVAEADGKADDALSAAVSCSLSQGD